MQITEEQAAILAANDQRILCGANAGTGKTTTAVLKILRLVEQGLAPTKIVALSYSLPGVQAFKDAFRRLRAPTGIAEAVRIGKVEDFCTARLRKLEGSGIQRLTRPEKVRPHVLTEQLDKRLFKQAKLATWEFIGGTMRMPGDEVDPTAEIMEECSQSNFFEYVLPRLIETAPLPSTRNQLRQAMQLAKSDRVDLLLNAVQALVSRSLLGASSFKRALSRMPIRRFLDW